MMHEAIQSLAIRDGRKAIVKGYSILDYARMEENGHYPSDMEMVGVVALARDYTGMESVYSQAYEESRQMLLQQYGSLVFREDGSERSDREIDEMVITGIKYRVAGIPLLKYWIPCDPRGVSIDKIHLSVDRQAVTEYKSTVNFLLTDSFDVLRQRFYVLKGKPAAAILTGSIYL